MAVGLPVLGDASLIAAGTLAGEGRLFTAYLPPIWGWVTPAWMRRRVLWLSRADGSGVIRGG